jgi:hypothetical protein
MREHAYRLFQMGPDDHVVSWIDLFCDNDEDAAKQAQRLVDGQPVELWDGKCLLRRFEPAH